MNLSSISQLQKDSKVVYFEDINDLSVVSNKVFFSSINEEESKH